MPVLAAADKGLGAINAYALVMYPDEVREAMGPATVGITKVIVAQRVSTIVEADQILVLDGGHLVGSGTHTELLVTCAVYREIVTSQLGAEAAA